MFRIMHVLLASRVPPDPPAILRRATIQFATLRHVLRTIVFRIMHVLLAPWVPSGPPAILRRATIQFVPSHVQRLITFRGMEHAYLA